MDGNYDVNRRPIRLASDEKLERWRSDLERALLTPKPADESEFCWRETKRWVEALVAAIADEQADRGRRVDVPKIKRA